MTTVNVRTIKMFTHLQHPSNDLVLYSPSYCNRTMPIYNLLQVDVVWLRYDSLGWLQLITASNSSGEMKTFQIPKQLYDFKLWSSKKISVAKTSTGQKKSTPNY